MSRIIDKRTLSQAIKKTRYLNIFISEKKYILNNITFLLKCELNKSKFLHSKSPNMLVVELKMSMVPLKFNNTLKYAING